jgi:hypothetical protein
MEKYIIIIILAVILYTIYKNCSTTEAFGDVSQSVGGVDDQNAINTLAQVAKSLQAGGLTVPGNLIIDGELTQKNVNMVKGPNANRYVFHTPDDNRKGLWIAPAKDDSASDWLWGYSLNLKRDGNHYLGGNLVTGGNLDIGGVTTKAVNVWHKSKDAKNRVYYENAGTSYYGSGNGNHIFRLGGDGNGSEVIIDNQGNFKLPGKLLNSQGIGIEIVAASIGSYDGPLYGPGKKTYPFNQYMTMISGHYYVHEIAAAGPMIYTKDGIWYVRNYNHGKWVDANFLLIPRSMMGGSTATNVTNGGVTGAYTEDYGSYKLKQ